MRSQLERRLVAAHRNLKEPIEETRLAIARLAREALAAVSELPAVDRAHNRHMPFRINSVWEACLQDHQTHDIHNAVPFNEKDVVRSVTATTIHRGHIILDKKHKVVTNWRHVALPIRNQGVTVEVGRLERTHAGAGSESPGQYTVWADGHGIRSSMPKLTQPTTESLPPSHWPGRYKNERDLLVDVAGTMMGTVATTCTVAMGLDAAHDIQLETMEQLPGLMDHWHALHPDQVRGPNPRFPAFALPSGVLDVLNTNNWHPF